MATSLCLVVLALGACACATPPHPFTEAFYAPLRVSRAAVPRTPVVVFAFADQREGDPRVVGRYEPLDGQTRVERATVPVGQGVARAFARGLAARGFTVTDASARRYAAGDPAPAPVVVTGRVADFGVRIARLGFATGWDSRVGCRVTVEVWAPASGRRVAERSYQRVVTGAVLPSEPLAILAQVLADVVEQAIADQALVSAIR